MQTGVYLNVLTMLSQQKTAQSPCACTLRNTSMLIYFSPHKHSRQYVSAVGLKGES